MSRPVFIVGAPRSGTTFLYHVLLSSGGFANYRAESRAYDLIGPGFGDLRTEGARSAFLETWTRGYQFERSGLSERWIREQMAARCRSTGDFLRILMEGIARDQNVDRWAECTPTHALFLDRIVEDFPDARIIHMIRDGRDVALSMARQGWIRPLPGDAAGEEVVAALYWEWICRKGSAHGDRLGSRYTEVQFEDLVQRTESVLQEVGEFIEYPLDWEQVQRTAVGSVQNPNTSFEEESFDPVERWREAVASTRIAIESHVGALLRELGYAPPEIDRSPCVAGVRRRVYRALFDLKHRLKTNTPLGRILVSAEELARTAPD